MNPESNRSTPPAQRTVIDLLLALFEKREVDSQEVDLLLPTHRNEWLRPQVEAKLRQLHPNDPIHRELHHLVSLSLDLLAAVDSRDYKPAGDWADIEPRLKRALAYFIKSGDAIPDHLPTGFDDDHREFRDLAQRAGALLAHFEAVHRPVR